MNPVVKSGMFVGLLLFGVADNGFAQFLEMDERVFDAVKEKYGRSAERRVKKWHGMMVETNRQDWMDEMDKSMSANDFFNRMRWVSDRDHWGLDDYWATPIEMLGTNAGDCEDFSIGKYFTLSETGVDLEKLRITYVKALDYDQAHMVLAYYPSPEAEPWILDNINKTLLPASERTDLLPIYGFNGEGLWLAKSRGKKLSADTEKSLPKWGEVNKKMLNELMQ